MKDNMYKGLVLPGSWLNEEFPDEANEIKDLFLKAGWQDFNGCLMPSAEMLDAIAAKGHFIFCPETK